MMETQHDEGSQAHREYEGSLRWWCEEDDESILACLWPSYERFARLESSRLYDHRRFLRLYGVREHRPDPWELGFEPDRIQLNVIKACVDMVTAKIGKQRPRPQPETDNGNSTLVRKARLLQHYLDGQFRRERYYAKAAAVFRDAALVGTGHMAVYKDGDDVRYQRVLSDEILVDPTEGRFGDHRTMFRRRWVSRDMLAGRFPKLRAAIMSSAVAPANDWTVPGEGRTGSDRINDMVLLVEAIHLPSSEKSTDGLRVLCLKDVILSKQRWDYDYFPVVRVHWTMPVTGYWGHGLAEELYSIQIEINRIAQKIQAQMHLVSVMRVFVPIGTKIQPPQIDNRIGAIIPFSGLTPPVIAQPPGAAPDMYAHLWALWNKAFEISGVASMQLRDQGPKPISAIGQQTQHDIESERFAIPAQEYERMSVDVALQTIDRAKELAKSKKNYAVPAARDKYSLDHIEWSEIDMEADEFELGVFASSALPNDPGGRQAAVESLYNSGLIEPNEARVMLQFPDLERFLSLDRAAEDLIDTLIERMLDEGKYTPPEPFMDLQLALKKAQSHYNRAIIRNVPEDRLDQLRTFMKQAFTLLQKAQMEEARQNAAQAGQNQTMPEAGTPPAPGAQGAPPMASPQQ